MNQQNRIRLFLGVYLALAVAAFTVPRFAARSQEGLAAAGAAAFWFLLIAGAALLVSAASLVISLRSWRQIPPKIRTAGLLPACLSVLIFLGIVLAVKFRGEEESRPNTPVKPVTAPVASASP